MCKVYTNTRWACNHANKCKPGGKVRLHSYLHPQAPPFRKTCNNFNALTGLCSKPDKGAIDSTEIHYRSLQCPLHHNKRLASLQLHWDMEWNEQVIEAKKVKGYRECALRKKWDAELKRDLVMMELLSDAQTRNDQFYLPMFLWQANTITLARQELAETMKWE